MDYKPNWSGMTHVLMLMPTFSVNGPQKQRIRADSADTQMFLLENPIQTVSPLSVNSRLKLFIRLTPGLAYNEQFN